MDEYPITNAYKIIGQVLAAALIVWGIIVINMSRTAHPSGQIPLIIFGAIFVLLGGWMMVGATRLSVTIDDDAVRVRGALGTRELPRSEIDGYRSGDKNRFYLVRSNGKGFSIPDYIAQRSELIQWVKTHYSDVDARERAAETKVVLQDERYGATEADRKKALEKARNLVWILVPFSFVISFGLLLFQQVHALLYLVYILPWIAVFLTWQSNGMIRLSMRKSTPHPSLVFAMGVPAFILTIYGSRSDLYGFSTHAWTVTTLAAIATILIAFATLRRTIALERQKGLAIVLIIIIAGAYGFGAAISSNAVFDNSNPQTLNATVLWKTVHRGRSTSYSLDLSPWGRYTKGRKVTVSRVFFNGVRRGDTVDVLLYPGKWGMPWYRVTAIGQ